MLSVALVLLRWDYVGSSVCPLVLSVAGYGFLLILLGLILSPGLKGDSLCSLFGGLGGSFSRSVIGDSPAVLVMVVSLSRDLLSLVLHLFLVPVNVVSLCVSSVVAGVFMGGSIGFSGS